jgi:hypothetical protein
MQTFLIFLKYSSRLSSSSIVGNFNLSPDK